MEDMKKIRTIMTSKAFAALKEMMLHWGFSETESSIYALLALYPQDLTAREIAELIDRAYSSVVNEINKLIRYGLVVRRKKNKCYHYGAVIDMVQIVRNEREKVRELLNEAKEAMVELPFENEELKEHLNEVLKYFRKLEEVR